ncbi:hypothetical protein BPT24_269 [Tenacibaculum phage pT24]|uniref:Uncharacterized protein n=1 Tax=Tenacibaculum phage pT24 TaxID=1880590 RepID=A0A1B4XX47_9CAUD|nr:hypothetical protein HYP10_gp259 [Tenacibaculum phage pT24]BAV39386.1 hypothetical protein BPT24_269 [Tenacibaculum phage pT24]
MNKNEESKQNICHLESLQKAHEPVIIGNAESGVASLKHLACHEMGSPLLPSMPSMSVEDPERGLNIISDDVETYSETIERFGKTFKITANSIEELKQDVSNFYESQESYYGCRSMSAKGHTTSHKNMLKIRKSKNRKRRKNRKTHR